MVCRFLKLIFAFYCLVTLFGCNVFSIYPIDEQPLIKLDTRFLGKWKIIEDTDKANYLSIREMPGIEYQTAAELKLKPYNLYVTYWNRHGVNPVYGDFTWYISKIGNKRFINIHGTNIPADESFEALEKGVGLNKKWGFYFADIVNINQRADSIILAIVGDSTLKDLTNSQQVRERIQSNMNNRNFYSHVLHLYRVN